MEDERHPSSVPPSVATRRTRERTVAVTSVFCFLLSALSLVWVLVVISPQTLPAADAARRRLGDLPREADGGPLGPRDRHALGHRRDSRRSAGRSPTASRSVPRRESDRRRRAVRRARDRRHSRSRAADDRLDSAGRRRRCSSRTRLRGPWLATIGLAGIAHRGYDLPRLVGNLYMTLEGIYGVPLDVAVTYIMLFSLYGAVLERSGAGTFFLDFAMSLSSARNPAAAAGRSVTLAGFLLGTVSGQRRRDDGHARIGRVAGACKRVGFAPDTAGAMLAASGIGALLSPPTLGAAAFLIAEYLRISYLQVLIMATIPTLLYYLSILLMIEGEQRRRFRGSGFRGSGVPTVPGSVEPAPRTRVRRTRRTPEPGTPEPEPQYLHFLSLVLVAVLMAIGLSPFRAVFWATIAAVALSLSRAARTSGWRRAGWAARSSRAGRTCCPCSPPPPWPASSSASSR